MSLVFWEPVVGETTDDAELVVSESDEATSVGVVEGVEFSVVVDELGGAVTTVLSAGEDAEPEDDDVLVSDADADSTGVDELDPVELDESGVVVESAGRDDVESDEVMLVDVVSLEDDDDVMLAAEVSEIDSTSEEDG